ncbi:MAG: alpha/beta hydrolase [Opitutaceae bacterium]|nr:alpha/beta hydrolase [Opitutaceae bacterium]
MKNTLRLAALVFLPVVLLAQPTPPKPDIPYGKNPTTGKFAEVNGIKLYYETYGEGAPLLIIHGNGGAIAPMKPQLDFFVPHYRVIVADSRGHGKSDMGPGRLTYEQMAEDLNALLDQLKVKSAYVLGQSDGGILGLLLAIHHPDKVGKLAAMGANLNPAGEYSWTLEADLKEGKLIDEMIAQGDQSQPWAAKKQYLDLVHNQPDIALADLEKISAPVLVMAGDKDVIRLEHTQQIFEHLKQAHLAIFPGATHFVRRENPDLFNQTVAKFFREPFTRPDTRDVFK